MHHQCKVIPMKESTAKAWLVRVRACACLLTAGALVEVSSEGVVVDQILVDMHAGRDAWATDRLDVVKVLA